MPFTLAHPAAVLPLHARWREGFWGLVFGSVGPDIPYFLPARLGEALPKAHSIVGAMTIAAPMALALLLIVAAGRRILTAPMWGALRPVAEQELGRILHSPRCWAHLIPAAIVGAEIHLLWDSFTHKEGWMVLHVPVLAIDVSPVPGSPLKLFRALQYVSSVIGMAALLVWGRRRLRHHGPSAGGWRPGILGACAAIALGNAARAMLTAPPHTVHSHTVQYVGATTAVATFIALYTVLGAVIVIQEIRSRTGGHPHRRGRA